MTRFPGVVDPRISIFIVLRRWSFRNAELKQEEHWEQEFPFWDCGSRFGTMIGNPG